MAIPIQCYESLTNWSNTIIDTDVFSGSGKMQEQENSTIKIETGYIDKLLEKNSDWFIAEHLSNSDQLFPRKVIVSAFQLFGWETVLEADADPPQMCVFGKFLSVCFVLWVNYSICCLFLNKLPKETNLASQISQPPFSYYLFLLIICEYK